MAYTSRQIDVGIDDAFAALIDPASFPQWLIGAKTIRGVDAGWPRPGSRFHHVVGVGLLQIADYTEVLAIERPLLLRLHVRALPFVSAVATFTVVGDSDRCVVTLQEEPAVRWLGNAARVVMDPATHVRNHRSLVRLARYLGVGSGVPD